jgi:hypothetical protein
MTPTPLFPSFQRTVNKLLFLPSDEFHRYARSIKITYSPLVG